jgi:hypothetical protein
MVTRGAFITPRSRYDSIFPEPYNHLRTGSSVGEMTVGEMTVHGRFDTTQRFPSCPITAKVDC